MAVNNVADIPDNVQVQDTRENFIHIEQDVFSGINRGDKDTNYRKWIAGTGSK
jgi:hypothetical protein